MRVLITNITLASRSGTEVNVRDIAFGLLRRGHEPIVYSPELGVMASEIRAATVPVVDEISAVGAPPDVIHGHHNAPTLTALLRFPGAPAVFFCHDWDQWFDEPPRFPRLLRYAPVDLTVRDRLISEHGVAPEKVTTILNAIDLRRFPARDAAPVRLRRAAIFSARKCGRRYLESVREACAGAGIELELLGAEADSPIAEPEAALRELDLVFARGRCALEALAAGCAVILAGESGLGELVTEGAFERLRGHNFGRRELWRPWTVAAVTAEIERYDAADAGRVAHRVREVAGLEGQLDELERLYREVIDENRQLPRTPEAELAAAAELLERWSPRLGGDFYRAKSEAQRLDELRLADRLFAAERAAENADERLRSQGDSAAREVEALRGERDRLAAELAALRLTAASRSR